jgi:hypothetical protein
MRPPLAVGVHTGSGRDGTGEAVLVALRPARIATAGDGDAGAGGVEVVRRIAVTLADERGGQVLHRAQGLPPKAATALVDDAAALARRLAGAAIADLLADVEAEDGVDGWAIVVGVPAGVDVGDIERGLGEVLASHRLIHVAEVALFRDALADAAEDAGLAVVRLPDADVAGEARARAAELAALGRAAGRPWRKAEREAATAAFLALASPSPSASPSASAAASAS